MVEHAVVDRNELILETMTTASVPAYYMHGNDVTHVFRGLCIRRADTIPMAGNAESWFAILLSGCLC